MSVRLTITKGNESVAQLDVLPLTPHSQVTRVYEVPVSKLTVFADAAGGAGTDALDVLIYGSKDSSPHQGWWKPLAFRRSKIIEVPKGTSYPPTALVIKNTFVVEFLDDKLISTRFWTSHVFSLAHRPQPIA